MSSKKTEKQHSYGVVPVYYGKHGAEILIVKHANSGHWGFPKGTPEKGESPEKTAVREFMEETGLMQNDFEINFDAMCEESYEFVKGKKIIEKTNTFYLGTVHEKWVGEVASDIIDTKWVLTDEVADNVTYSSTNQLFEKFRHFIEK